MASSNPTIRDSPSAARPLQNRVTPTGDIIATPHRGLFTGNRGIIHDPATKTLLKKRWASEAWIVCALSFRGVRREPMGRRSWTELFFLDEATAFAAGHRPCFLCRRADANRFRAAWETGNGGQGLKAREIDRILHRERLDRSRKRMHPPRVPVDRLPEGTMIQDGADSFLVARGRTLLWSPDGYVESDHIPHHAMMLTPPSILNALAAGYRPMLHPSAGR